MSLVSQIKEIKLALVKAIHLTDQDISTLENQQEGLYKNILDKLELFSQFFCTRIEALVNEKVELTEEQ